jgi:hypothetical protein
MTTTRDPFFIDIALRHPSYRAEDISAALSIEPKIAHSTGDPRESHAKWKRSSFLARLREGNLASDFDGALADIARFVERHSLFWTEFVGGGGEVELILNHEIPREMENGDKCFELFLDSVFLRLLSARSIGLRVQGWARTE